MARVLDLTEVRNAAERRRAKERRREWAERAGMTILFLGIIAAVAGVLIVVGYLQAESMVRP